MKVLGISGSPRSGQTTDRLVREILGAVECETEFVSLAGKHIAPCIACLGCIRDNVCTVRDDMYDLRAKIVEADAYVVGAPNYYSMLNAQTHCFLERFYQFRHREGKCVAGKPGVAAGVGGSTGDAVVANIERFFEYNGIQQVGSVSAQGPASCFTCGYGESCKTGAIHMFFGPGTKVTEDMIPSLDKQPQVLEKAHDLARELGRRLKDYAAAT